MNMRLKFFYINLRLLFVLTFALGLALTLGVSGMQVAPVEAAPLERVQAAWDVTDMATLNAAIAAVNAEVSGTHTITFVNDITLIANATTINLQPGVTLSIEGAGYTLNGDGASRGFTILGVSTVEIRNLTITNGYDVLKGGGIENTGTLTVTNSTFSGNSSSDTGGGIDNTGTLTVTNSTFSGNSALWGGGILSWGTLTVTNSTFSGNSASSEGGGIWNWGTLMVTNSTFSGNSAAIGGGISNRGTLNLVNTILANSTAGGDCVNSGTMGTDENNLIEANTGCGTPVSSADPGLGPLQDNGGQTHTMAIDHTSPAFNTGDNTLCPASDQRGVARPQGETCDIGAFEYDGLELKEIYLPLVLK